MNKMKKVKLNNIVLFRIFQVHIWRSLMIWMMKWRKRTSMMMMMIRYKHNVSSRLIVYTIHVHIKS